MDTYPEISFTVGNEFKKLDTEKVTPWVFFNSGRMPAVKTFDGREIVYRGLGFEGSPRDLFWRGFIEPYLEDVFARVFQFALDYAEKRNHDYKDVILFTEQCLRNGIYKIYHRMSDVDRRLRGKGFPDKVQPKDVSLEIGIMDRRLQEYRDSALLVLSLRNKETTTPNLSEALELKPRFFGMSVDLKKLYQWLKSKILAK